MKKTRWLMLVCVLFLCVSVVKADGVPTHKISVESELSIFDSDTNTFTFTPGSDRTIYFNVGYELLNPNGGVNITFALDILFDESIFEYAGQDAYYPRTAYNSEPYTFSAGGGIAGVALGWNDNQGWYREPGYLYEKLTFNLKDGVSLDELFLTEITFSLYEATYKNLDAPTITVMFVQDEAAVPEPATLVMLGLAAAGIPVVRRLRRG